MDVTFRRLTDEDLPLLHRWLNEPGVVRWWEGDDVSWDAVVREYGSANPEPAEHWLALVDEEPVGWIQCYAWSDYDDEDETRVLFAAGIDRSAGGIDYLVGDPVRRRRGIGTAMIRSFVHDIVFPRHPTWTQLCAGPFVANEASWRALEASGFRRFTDIATTDGPCRLMVIDRPGGHRPEASSTPDPVQPPTG